MDEPGVLDLGDRGKREVCRQPTWFSGKHDLWGNKGFLMEMGAEIL